MPSTLRSRALVTVGQGKATAEDGQTDEMYCQTSLFRCSRVLAYAPPSPRLRRTGAARSDLSFRVPSGMTFVLRMGSNTNRAQRHPGARASRPLKRPNAERASACHLCHALGLRPAWSAMPGFLRTGRPRSKCCWRALAARQLIPLSITPARQRRVASGYSIAWNLLS